MFRYFFQRYPLLARCTICSLGGSISDAIAQKFVEKNEKLNLERTRCFTILGFCMVGPALTYWYNFLEKRFLMEQNKYKAVFYKVSLDQIVFTPIFQIIYIAVLSILQGFNIEQTENRIYKKTVPILIINYKLMPISQLINFFLIPVPYQVIYVQFIAVVWNIIVSSELNNKKMN